MKNTRRFLLVILCTLALPTAFLQAQVAGNDDDVKYDVDSAETLPSFSGGTLESFSVWIRQNTEYPEAALKDDVQGRVTVGFVIEKDGELSNLKIVSSPHPALSQAVLRAITKSPKEWTPGEKDGEPVPVYLELPVDFKVPAEPISKTVNLIENPKERKSPLVIETTDDTAFTIKGDTVTLEVAPLFQGEEAESFFKWVWENTEFSFELAEQGNVVIGFSVDADGSLTNIEVLKSPHPDHVQAVLRTMHDAPKWTPGLSAGEAVIVPYKLVINTKKERINKYDLWEIGLDAMSSHEQSTSELGADEELPKFKKGGVGKFRDWVIKKLEYPEDVFSSGYEGLVLVKFVVERDGSVSNIELLAGSHPSLAQAVMRTIASSPKWTPGKQNGEPIRVSFNLPVMFKIPSSDHF